MWNGKVQPMAKSITWFLSLKYSKDCRNARDYDIATMNTIIYSCVRKKVETTRNTPKVGNSLCFYMLHKVYWKSQSITYYFYSSYVKVLKIPCNRIYPCLDRPKCGTLSLYQSYRPLSAGLDQ